MIQSFLIGLPILFSICLFVASLITNIDLKTKIQIKSVFFKFTKIISIGFYIFHIISCLYWIFSIGGSSINNQIVSYTGVHKLTTITTNPSSNDYFSNNDEEFLKMIPTSILPLKMDLDVTTTTSMMTNIGDISDSSSYRYYFKLLIQSVKFYQFNDTIIILIPLIFAAISIIFVYLKNSLVNRILFIKIQGFRNETPAGYDVLIRVLYIFMFVFILIIGHFGNLVCLKVNAFEKIGICSYHNSNNFISNNYINNSFWYYQGFINTLYLVYGYPLYELVNLI
ncbi:hypothetical protein RB653_007357 [Dictyostelium firmibasis]|uniref:Uncharacterized protein n=1 Tax=Dictyostelium firmibasis TaxID=79012 RepID=A0AAN7YR70_9MYCE